MPSVDTYSGNPLLKRANVNLEFTAEQIQEYIKCSKDPVYFARNYVKIVSLDEGLIPFKMYKFQEKLIRNFHKHRFNICKLPRQVGKSFKLDTPIPTPTGWTTMGDVKVGDVIFGRDGKHTIVTSKSKIHSIDTYEIEFDTGEILKACSQHRWKVSHSDWNHKEKVLTTKDIIDKFEVLKSVTKPSSIYINAPEAIEMPEADLPIDPYTFGAWLGDGSRATGHIVGVDEDIKIIASNIPLEVIKTNEVSGNDKCSRYWFKNLNEELRNLNVTEEKVIPDIYLRASVNQRLELLRGLMDTDGCAYPNGACEFYQKDGILLHQVRELISSLGIKTRIRFKKVAGYDGNYGTIRFTTTRYEVFKLPRKLERQKNCKNHPKNTRLYIKDIRQVEPELMQCLSVDNEDHMFLCGRTFIPTHNSTTAISYLIHYIIFNDNANIALLANKAQTAKELLGRLQLAYENLPKWLQHGVKIWNKASLELDNGSKIIASSTSGSAIRGGSYNVIFLDEFAFIPNQIADEFFSSVYPTITSGKNTKVIMVSCVSKDTYLLTPKGYQKIERFIDFTKSGAYQVPEYSVMGRDKFYTSDIIVNNQKSKTNIIKTRYETLECSQNHKLWAYKNGQYGYFESKDLSVGDYISVKYNHQVFGNDDYVGFFPEKGKSINTFNCEYVNEDVAYFIGLYIAEGYARDIISKRTNNITGGQIVISCGDDISQSLDKLSVPYTKADDVHYIINSKHLVDFIKELGFDITKKAKEKILPDKVLAWSKSNITALLRGMFDGDGCIDSKGRVKYTSTSRELIRQVQLLLANLGILGSIYTSTVGPTKKVKVSSTNHNIEIVGKYAFKYFEEIGFGLSRKQERISLLTPSNRNGSCTDIIPNSVEILKSYNVKLPHRSCDKCENYSRQLLISHKDLICEDTEAKEFFNDNIDENLIWLKIKGIEESDNEVFDVSLPDIDGDKWAHSVLYNNFLGHQTPKGMNAFYKFWTDAIRGKNEYVPTEVHWSEVPGRDEKWKAQTIANTSKEQWEQEFESLLFETLLNIEVDGKIVQTTIGELYNDLSNKGTT